MLGEPAQVSGLRQASREGLVADAGNHLPVWGILPLQSLVLEQVCVATYRCDRLALRVADFENLLQRRRAPDQRPPHGLPRLAIVQHARHFIELTAREHPPGLVGRVEGGHGARSSVVHDYRCVASLGIEQQVGVADVRKKRQRFDDPIELLALDGTKSGAGVVRRLSEVLGHQWITICTTA